MDFVVRAFGCAAYVSKLVIFERGKWQAMKRLF